MFCSAAPVAFQLLERRYFIYAEFHPKIVSGCATGGLSRRTFLAGGACGGLPAARTIHTAAAELLATFMRPPGVRTPWVKLVSRSLCALWRLHGCVCPSDVLKPDVGTAGIPGLLRQNSMSVRVTAGRLHRLCYRLSTGAIPLMTERSQARPGIAHINESICISYTEKRFMVGCVISTRPLKKRHSSRSQNPAKWR